MLSSFPRLCGILCMRMNLGIYIQVPFCQTKCTYCNFHTGVFAQSLYLPYVNAVCRELAERVALYRGAGIAVPPRKAVGNGFRTGTALAAPPAYQTDPSLEHLSAEGVHGQGFSSPVVDTLYIGGGTPSLLEPAALQLVVDALHASFECAIEE